MIARMWTARASLANATSYAAHLRDAVLPQVRSLTGYRGATLLERRLPDEVEIIVITWWQSLEDVRAFAGVDTDRAVVTDDARAMLTSCDEQVRHFRVELADEPRDERHVTNDGHARPS